MSAGSSTGGLSAGRTKAGAVGQEGLEAIEPVGLSVIAHPDLVPEAERSVGDGVVLEDAAKLCPKDGLTSDRRTFDVETLLVDRVNMARRWLHPA